MVVKASASRAADQGSISVFAVGIFPGRVSSETFKTQNKNKKGTPEATLPGAWHDTVSAGTDWPGVSILGLG